MSSPDDTKSAQNQPNVAIDTLLQQAMELVQSGQISAADELCHQIIKQEPQNPNALYLLGINASKTGNYKEAIQLINAAISNNPQDPGFHFALGQAYEGDNKPADALAAYDQALKIYPQHPSAQLHRGLTLRTLGHLEEAITAFRSTTKINPASVPGQLFLGQTLLESQSLKEAASCLRNLLDNHPEIADAHLALGTTLKALGYHKEALDHLEQSIAIKPLQQAYLRKGEILMALDRYEEAQQNYQVLFKHERGEGWGQKPFTVNANGSLHTSEQTAQVSPFFLENLAGHIIYLIDKKKLDPSFKKAAQATQSVLNEINISAQNEALVSLNPGQLDRISSFYHRALHFSDTAKLESDVLNQSLDFLDIEDRYLNSELPMVVFDDFLTPATLKALRDFCMESTIFFRQSHNNFMSTYVYEGFNCSALYQIVRELKKAFPHILGNKELRNMWAYRYGAKGEGVRPHSDQAAVTVNFWITPDDANLDPEHGGLVIYDRQQPMDWDWHKINLDKDKPEMLDRLNKFLEGAKTVTVPYRENRAVIFHSNLFHASDSFYFKDDYSSRRMNITLLFGDRNE